MACRRRLFVAVMAVAVAGGIALAGAAPTAAQKRTPSAQAKISYAEAFKRCKAMLDRDIPLSAENQNERYVRGGACMKRYGYGF